MLSLFGLYVVVASSKWFRRGGLRFCYGVLLLFRLRMVVVVLIEHKWGANGGRANEQWKVYSCGAR